MTQKALTHELYFTTSTVVDWLDVFTRPIYKHIFKFWQEDNHVETIYSYDFFKQKLDYIHQNPVRQEIVAQAEDYMYSSARNYAGMDGLLNVIVAQ